MSSLYFSLSYDTSLMDMSYVLYLISYVLCLICLMYIFLYLISYVLYLMSYVLYVLCSYDLYLVSHVLCVLSCNYVLCVLRTCCWLVIRLHRVAGPPRLKADKQNNTQNQTIQIRKTTPTQSNTITTQHQIIQHYHKSNWCMQDLRPVHVYASNVLTVHACSR